MAAAVMTASCTTGAPSGPYQAQGPRRPAHLPTWPSPSAARSPGPSCTGRLPRTCMPSTTSPTTCTAGTATPSCGWASRSTESFLPRARTGHPGRPVNGHQVPLVAGSPRASHDHRAQAGRPQRGLPQPSHWPGSHREGWLHPERPVLARPGMLASDRHHLRPVTHARRVGKDDPRRSGLAHSPSRAPGVPVACPIGRQTTGNLGHWGQEPAHITGVGGDGFR